jgi:hypothetical protein
VIHGIALQTPDIDGVVDHVPAAPGLAGVLADVGAGSGEGIVLTDQAHGVGVASLAHQRHVARHVHAGGTQRHTGDRQLQTGQTPVVQDVLLVIVPETVQTVQHQPRRVPSDGAVGGVHNGAGRLFDDVDGAQVGGAVQHRFDELAQLPQTDAAGHALAAGLGVAQRQKRQRHVHGTQARRTGGDAALHVAVEVIHHRLCAAGTLDIKSAQGRTLLSSALRGQPSGGRRTELKLR